MDLEAPTFILPTVHGKDHGNLEFYRGKVVVLAFLSGFGPTSSASVEPLANLQAEMRGEVVVLGITSDSDSQLEEFVGANALPISMLRDTRRRVHERYHSEIVVPSLVVVGRDGFVRYADAGSALDMDTVVSAAQRAVRESKH